HGPQTRRSGLYCALSHRANAFGLGGANTSTVIAFALLRLSTAQAVTCLCISFLASRVLRFIRCRGKDRRLRVALFLTGVMAAVIFCPSFSTHSFEGDSHRGFF